MLKVECKAGGMYTAVELEGPAYWDLRWKKRILYSEVEAKRRKHRTARSRTMEREGSLVNRMEWTRTRCVDCLQHR